MAEAWAVTHLTFEDTSILYILANLGQLSTWGPPGFGLWVMHAHYQAGSAVTKTLVFHIYYSCARTIVGSCTHSHTAYSVCFHDGQYTCFNLIYHPRGQWLEVQNFTSSGKLIKHTQVNDCNKPVSIYFDVCTAVAENTGPWGNCVFSGASLRKDLQVKWQVYMPQRWQWDIRLCILWTTLLPLLGLWKMGNLA
jgi:hypothetical protein